LNYLGEKRIVPGKTCKAIFEFFNSICHEGTLAQIDSGPDVDDRFRPPFYSFESFTRGQEIRASIYPIKLMGIPLRPISLAKKSWGASVIATGIKNTRAR
jgi:hypothetical protein